MTISLSPKRLGTEALRLLGGFLTLCVLLFAVNSLPFLWPDVFPMASPAHSAAGWLYVLLTAAVMLLLRRSSGASLWEYGFAMAGTALFLHAVLQPVGYRWAGLLESWGASFDFVFATVGMSDSGLILFWAELELAVLALSKVPKLIAGRKRAGAV